MTTPAVVIGRWPQQEPYVQWRIACGKDADFKAYDDPEHAMARFPDSAEMHRLCGFYTLKWPYHLIRENLPKPPPPPPPFMRLHYEITGITSAAKREVSEIYQSTAHELRRFFDDLQSDTKSRLDGCFISTKPRRTKARKGRK